MTASQKIKSAEAISINIHAVESSSLSHFKNSATGVEDVVHARFVAGSCVCAANVDYGICFLFILTTSMHTLYRSLIPYRTGSNPNSLKRA